MLKLHQKVVFLDRDGVINQDSPDYIKSWSEFHFLPGSLEALRRLTQHGFRLFIITNQSVINRQMISVETLEDIHDRMRAQIRLHGGKIHDVFYCPHTPEDHCACRKPRPGLLESIARHYGVSLAGVPAIGDSLRDLQAAAAVGARPILVRTGKGERTLTNPDLPPDIPIYPDLAAAVAALLASDPVAEAHRENTAC